MVISFSLMNLMFNLGVIRKGEIKSWSLLGIKGLHPLHLNISIQVLHSLHISQGCAKEFCFGQKNQ